MTKTTNFNHLREQARASDPGWDAAVAERRNAMLDALAVGEPKPCPQLGKSDPAEPRTTPAKPQQTRATRAARRQS
jgi:hypothetical protein